MRPVPIEERELTAKQQDRSDEQHCTEYGDAIAKAAECCRSSIRAGRLRLLVIAAMMHRSRRRRREVGTGNDRHRPMLERRHEAGRCEQAQSKDERQ
jgi:hypothetical protein